MSLKKQVEIARIVLLVVCVVVESQLFLLEVDGVDLDHMGWDTPTIVMHILKEYK